MSSDKLTELDVPSLPHVNEREGVGIDGERATRNLIWLHLIELGYGRHECVPLLVSGSSVVQALRIDRPPRTLVLS